MSAVIDMQSMEAVISLMFFVSILTYMLGGIAEKPGLDDSLYRYQLTDDVWRVEQLRGNFKNFSFDSGNTPRDEVEADFDDINGLTGLCIYMGGIKVTSCSNEYSIAEKVASISRAVYIYGSVKNVTLTLAKDIS